MTQFSLEEITTRDNMIHQGIYAEPKNRRDAALVWVHGLTGKFYGDTKRLTMLADACIANDMGFAAFNNRGHDIVASARTVDPGSPTGRGYAMIGSGMEKFEDCVHDIDAAIGFLAGKGYTRIFLAGLSTGANKVCYYAGSVSDARLAGVILAGPMSDRYSPANTLEEYENNMTMLKMLIDDGKGDSWVTKAMWFPATANRLYSLIAPHTSEDVFNYGDDTDVLTRFSNIKTPLLVVLAGNDEHADRPIFDIQKAFDAHAQSRKYKSLIIPDADHGYTGKEEEFVTTLVSWMQNVLILR